MAKILLVDDMRDTLLIFGHWFQHSPPTLTCVQFPHDALVLLAACRGDSAPFDLLLLDVMMPMMSGVDMARELRREGDEIPIIVLSAHLEPLKESEVAECRIARVLQKPIDYHVLMDSVAAVLQTGEG